MTSEQPRVVVVQVDHHPDIARGHAIVEHQGHRIDLGYGHRSFPLRCG